MKKCNWTENDIEKLLENKDKPLTTLVELIGKSKYSVELKVKELGLKLPKNIGLVKALKDGMVKCSKCYIEKEYNCDNFHTKENKLICRECSKKILKIFRYKQNGIILDFHKMLDTYSPSEWVEFFISRNIKQYPSGYLNKEKIINMIRYIIIIKLKKENREVVISTMKKEIKSFGLFRQMNNYFNDWNEVIIECFPEYNIKPFELNDAPDGYYKIKENADFRMEHELLEFEKYNTMDDISLKLSSYFNHENLRMKKKNDLIVCINEHGHYNNFYEWINELRPNWNINKSDFKSFISKCGNYKLGSMGEKYLYDFLYDKGLNIKSVGRNKKNYSYYNEKYNESYIPDFVIEEDDEVKVIIEYFGLYQKNPNSKLTELYKQKTKRKIEYYNKLKDIKFLYFYPNDVRLNCKYIDEEVLKHII